MQVGGLNSSLGAPGRRKALKDGGARVAYRGQQCRE